MQQEIHGTEDARGIRCIGSAPSCGLALSTSLIDGSNELRRAIEADKTTAEARINLSLPVTFADPRSQFNGQAICGQPEMIDEIVLTKTEGGPPGQPHSNESFHPKVSGEAIYANVLDDVLQTRCSRGKGAIVDDLAGPGRLGSDTVRWPAGGCAAVGPAYSVMAVAA